MIFSLSGLTPLDNGFPQTCQEKVKKDLAGESTTVSVPAAEHTAGLGTNANLYRHSRPPQVGSKTSLAAKWQWQDHSVFISSAFFPWAHGSCYCGQCTASAVQSPAWWIGWTMCFRQPLTSFLLCPCVPASDNQKCFLLAAFIKCLWYGTAGNLVRSTKVCRACISARKGSRCLLCGLWLLSGWLCATLPCPTELSKKVTQTCRQDDASGGITAFKGSAVWFQWGEMGICLLFFWFFLTWMLVCVVTFSFVL